MKSIEKSEKIGNSIMRPLDELFAALDRSAFRSRFRLGAKERNYLKDKGLDMVM